MAYPATLDTYTPVQGTSLVSVADHATMHNAVGSAMVNIQTVNGTTAGTSIFKFFAAGDFAVRESAAGVFQHQMTGGTINNLVGTTPSFSGGTINNGVMGTPTLTLGSDATGDLYYRSTGGTATRLPIGTNGQLLTTNGTTPSWGAGVTDGWNASSDTYVYVSPTSFKITGADRTTTFTKGTRIKLTQTTVKYFVVVDSAFSTDTTVTITAGTDYTLANAAITLPNYSYQANPQGYPGSFTYSMTLTGFSGTPTQLGRFSVVGKVVTVMFAIYASASSTTGFTATLPITATGLANYLTASNGQGVDNGAATIVYGYVSTSGTVITFQKTVGTDASWTNSGNKSAFLQLSYEF